MGIFGRKKQDAEPVKDYHTTLEGRIVAMMTSSKEGCMLLLDTEIFAYKERQTFAGITRDIMLLRRAKEEGKKIIIYGCLYVDGEEPLRSERNNDYYHYRALCSTAAIQGRKIINVKSIMIAEEDKVKV